MKPEIDIFPDNAFFEDSDGRPKGGSWNGEVDGMKATYGAVEPGTEATYSIDSPEVIFVESGAVAIKFVNDGGNKQTNLHRAGSFFELPLDKEFTLEVVGDEKFVYGCLYPTDER